MVKTFSSWTDLSLQILPNPWNSEEGIDHSRTFPGPLMPGSHQSSRLHSNTNARASLPFLFKAAAPLQIYELCKFRQVTHTTSGFLQERWRKASLDRWDQMSRSTELLLSTHISTCLQSDTQVRVDKPASPDLLCFPSDGWWFQVKIRPDLKHHPFAESVHSIQANKHRPGSRWCFSKRRRCCEEITSWYMHGYFLIGTAPTTCKPKIPWRGRNSKCAV